MEYISAGLNWQVRNSAMPGIPTAKWMKDLRSKSPETYDHCVRVALLSERVAVRLSLSSEMSMNLMRGCFLHDIGKLFLPVNVLNHSGPLTESKWRIMKLHPVLGAHILETDNGICEKTQEIVKYHHERWDGQGYPYGLAEDDIPFLARICSIIDAFDCMIAGRPYQSSKGIQEAKEELLRHAGTQFDGNLVNVFVNLINEGECLFWRG